MDSLFKSLVVSLLFPPSAHSAESAAEAGAAGPASRKHHAIRSSSGDEKSNSKKGPRRPYERDRVSTCCKFALDAELADYLRTQSLDQLMSFVANVGQTSLFPPREDLLSLLTAPAPLAAPLAAVRLPRALAAHARR